MDTSTEENEANSAAVSNSDGEKKHSMMNGFTNGYDKEKKEKSSSSHRDDKDRDREKHRDKDDKHRSKDKDKHRDKERDKDKDKHRDKDKERERDKSKHSSSSSSKDKHSSSSSSKDKDRDKDRKDRDKDKERSKHHDDKDKDRKDKEHKSSSSSEHKSSSSSSKDKSSSSSKHNSSSSSSKPSSSSSSKDKEHRDKERDKDKHRDRDKEKDKERSKDKDKEREKHSSSSSKDKDKHRSDKDKHRSSSSSKDKDRHSTSSSSKDKDKHREKERTKEKKESEPEIKQEIKEELPEVKQEKYEDSSFNNTSIKDESMDDDDDYNKLTIKEEATDDDESKMDFTASSVDTSAVKKEEEDDDDIPMAARMEKMNNRFLESEDEEDDVPLIARKKPKKESSAKKRKKADSDYEDDDEEDFKPAKKKKIKKEVETKKKKSTGSVKVENASPTKKKKKEEEEQEVWKWWEEEKKPDGVKWNFLEHKGPVFAAPYEPLPDKVKFYYDDDEFKLSEPAEEVATFYARMLDHDYTTKEAFNTNFMNDWRSVMTEKERKVIKDLRKCNFKHMHAYFLKKSEERKAMSKEEKKAIKEENEKIQKEYGFCLIDGHKEKIGNFKIEPPALFRGRGEHPKMGKLKRRVVAEDIIINCSKKSNIPQPPPGHRWKEVRHDNSVTWLASWTENVQGQVKYIMLNPSSKLKGEKDWQKYEMARKLAKSIDKIREDYTADWKSKEMRVRQRAVAMYFIDKLALRAGNEKDEDQADTVGCCSLRVEHISLHEQKDGKENVVVFDFLGKDSIRYYNEVPVEKRVFKNLVLFMENKKGEDDLFDRLNTAVLNKHLSDLMDGLTAKVFRTYNASWTLQAQLKELTDPNSTVAEKMFSYNRANRAVAILCNHQRAVPKTHDKSMANLREKLQAKRDAVDEAEKSYKHAKRDAKNGGSVKERTNAEKAKKTLERLKEQLQKLELQETDKEENKAIALGTSKLNYLDPRISVAWCKKFDVPIEKIYNKTQRDKFRWAIDMATADYVF